MGISHSSGQYTDILHAGRELFGAMILGFTGRRLPILTSGGLGGIRRRDHTGVGCVGIQSWFLLDGRQARGLDGRLSVAGWDVAGTGGEASPISIVSENTKDVRILQRLHTVQLNTY